MITVAVPSYGAHGHIRCGSYNQNRNRVRRCSDTIGIQAVKIRVGQRLTSRGRPYITLALSNERR